MVKDSNEPSKVGTPVIIDLGRKNRKRVRELKKGEGIYQSEVLPTIDEVIAGLPAEDKGKAVVPVVVIYEKKPRRKKTLLDLIVK